MAELGHFIAGERVAGTSGRFADVLDPTHGTVQSRVATRLTGQELASFQATQRQVQGWLAARLGRATQLASTSTAAAAVGVLDGQYDAAVTAPVAASHYALDVLETDLADVDDGYYCACYLRAWALESHVRAHLTREHGEDWFARPAAGEELKRLWAQGQRLSAEELLAEVTGETLDFGLLLADVGIS